MAPEVMEQVTGYDFKADIWSLGITTIELVTGTAPYHKYPPMKVLMLTLQNDPPTLETCQEERDQYKSYGKSIRKFIADCLQKDPSRRPTATELLKHPFITRKSRDKSYLSRVLLERAPSIEERTKMVMAKRSLMTTGTVGRLHLTETGDWVWSPFELPLNPGHEQQIRPPPLPSQNTINNANDIKLVLRIRNVRGELTDIRFDMNRIDDTAEAITQELVEASLVDKRDFPPIRAALATILINSAPGAPTNAPRSILFPLLSHAADYAACQAAAGLAPPPLPPPRSHSPQTQAVSAAVPSATTLVSSSHPSTMSCNNMKPADEQALIGFAQLSVVDSFVF